MISLPGAWLLAGAAFCSVIFWRAWPVERRRIYAAWTLIGLDLICRALGTPLKGAWLSELGGALGELALIQFLTMLLSQLLVRRWAMHMILSDLGIAGAYLFVIFRLLTRLGTDVNGLIATSTVITAILGLSIQDILVNSVSGIVLHLENELSQGDFIETDKGSGWIRKVRTRYTAIETPESDIVLIPNQNLTKNTVKLATASRRILVPFQLDYRYLPTKVIEEVHAVLRMSLPDGIARSPTPYCVVRGLHPDYVEYAVYVWITTPGHQQRQVSELLTRVYFGLARVDMPVLAVTQKVELQESAPYSVPDKEQQVSLAVLRQADIFRALTEAELTFLAARLRPVSFAPGETVVNQGDQGESVYIVVMGRLGVWLLAENGRSEQVATIHPGSLFGEISLLTGEPRSASVVAIDQVDCQRLDRPDFAAIIEQRPELADEISQIMEKRQQVLSTTRERLNSAGISNEPHRLLARIQKVFRISGKPDPRSAAAD